MPGEKPLVGPGIPTLIKESGEQEDATLVQTRGPWSLADIAYDAIEISGQDPLDEDLPDPPSPPPPPPAEVSRPRSQRFDSFSETAQPVIGDRYQVEMRIGEGGMGRVYRVKHLELGKTFALKIMRSQFSEDEKLRKAFFREARLASSLSHPQIVSIVDFGEDPRYGVYMVMELLEGESLRSMLHERGRFPLRQACDILLQVADAIRYVHDKGVIHCDLKSENVLLSTERGETGRRTHRAKLLDFGLARTHAGPDRSMTLSGTPAYIAPERIRGAPPSPSMDIYALGILFYELLTGAPPFSGEIESVLYHHVNEPPRPPSQSVSGLDESVEALILKALAKSPDDRPKNVGAFIYELRTAMEMLGYGTRRRSRSRPPVRGDSATDLVAGLFAECPLPMVVLSGDGTILVGNKAFSVFVSGREIDLRGVGIAETSLQRVCPSFLHQVRTVVAEGRYQRVVIDTPTPQGTVELMAWLTPGPADTDHVYCVVHVTTGPR